ncbi:helicase-associated domain-containing protein [Myceligenerans crystallogenes]|uniref:Helicase-associated domain-containing protein n=1 Tax=Myceligenerans crystallogenes TaxID=316335 RepID=A0ABP4ZLW8_9MICO
MASSLPEAPATATWEFARHLRQRPDTALVALLRTRGDLAVPSPATLRSLAARASSHTSLERALTLVNALELQVVEAVTALPGKPIADIPVLLGAATRGSVGDHELPVHRPSALDGNLVVVEQSSSGAPGPAAGSEAIGRAVGNVLAMALIWDDDGALRPSPGLGEILGPHVAGLGPARRDPAADAESLPARIAHARKDQRAVLDALAWGPPIGRLPAAGTRHREAVDALITSSLLSRADAQHVLLPRDVALALRDGRTHRAPELRPQPPGHAVPAATVAAESAAAALELVRRLTVLRTLWSDDPPRVLRNGGLGVRDLKRLAAAMECGDDGAAFVVELAAGAGLVRDDGEPEPSFVPVDSSWDELADADRWAEPARTWLTSRRTPWRVGSRDDGGALRSALSEDLERGWVPRLRASVLRILAASEHALTADEVTAILTWESPRNAPPREAIDGLLAEAATLGVTGAGALAPPGRALVEQEDLAGALRQILPAEVDEILLQGDLTGVVPGRPSRTLARLVELTADTESRGAATTVRFSPASVTRALDRGRTADDLLAELARYSPLPVPQPLDYLVRDTARRHGAVRVGTASSYLRAADEVTLAGLERDPALAHLGLVRLAPTVLIAAVPPALLHETLRERGVVSALEGPGGRVLDVRRAGARGRPAPTSRPARAYPGHPGSEASRRSAEAALAGRSEADLSALVAALRSADDDARRASGAELEAASDASGPHPPPGTGRTRPRPSSDSNGGTGTQPPADGLALLREAVRDGSLVRVDVVGAAGKLERRTLRPLRLDGGRLRAVDPARDAELTVAVHRIARVAPADTP